MATYMPHRVKIFTGLTNEVETEMNKWFAENPSGRMITHVVQSSTYTGSNTYIQVMVVY